MKAYKIAIAIALVAMPSAAWAYESTKTERNSIKAGNAAFKKGNYVEALRYYDDALAASPGSEYAMFNQATALYNIREESDTTMSNANKAKEIYDYLGQHGRDVRIKEKANYNLGNIAFHEQDYKQSIEYYKRVLRSNPANQRARENLLVALLKMPPEDENQQDQQQDQQQEQEQQEQEQQQQQQQQQQEQQMSGSSEQILQTMQNRENQTREKTKKEENAQGRYTDKPW